MINPNSSAIAQTISSLIQQTETKFQQKKEKNNSTLTSELQKAIEMTDAVIKTIEEGLDEQSRLSFHQRFDATISEIKTTFTALAVPNEPVLDQINSLKKSNEALGLNINNKLAEFLQEPNLSTLKTKANVDHWIETINSKLDETISTSEENKKIDSRCEDIKNKLTELSSILESGGKVETLIQYLKTNWEISLTPQEVTEFLQKINALETARIPIAQVLELNQRIDNLLLGAKTKIANFPLELDREVQGELAKLIKLAGRAQILLEERFDSNQESNNNAPKIKSFSIILPKKESNLKGKLRKLIKLAGRVQILLEERFDSNQKSNNNAPKIKSFSIILPKKESNLKKESYSSRIVQVKAVVDYLEIAIESLTGNPNLVLSQKLRYASEVRLRKIEGKGKFTSWWDGIYHSVKIPTKVLFGVVSALPISWFLINGNVGCNEVGSSPIKKVLEALPVPNYSPVPADERNPPPLNNIVPIEYNCKALNFVIALLMTGTLGGAVSVLSRLQEFDNPKTQKYEDDLLPIFIGLIKPILGGSFAFFIFLLLNSGVSPIQISGKDARDSNYFYGLLAVAFIAGFSERFVPDLISQTEKKLVTPKSPEQLQGMPSTLKIEPSNTKLNYEQKQTFILRPTLLSSDYQLVSTLDSKGKFENKTPSTFDYVAPTKDEAGTVQQVTINVTTKETPARTATAIITLGASS